MKSWLAGLAALSMLGALCIFTTGCESGGDDEADPVVTTNVTALVAPTQVSPANGASFNHFPRTTTLVWSSVPGAAKYGVEIQKNDGSWSALTTVETTDPTYTFDFIGAQPGRWRVWAIDAEGAAGPKSGWFEFDFTV